MAITTVLACLLLSAVALGSTVDRNGVYTEAYADAFTLRPVYTERDLRRDLFSDYDKLVRPVKSFKKTVPLSVSVSLLALKDVDEKNQAIILQSWIQMRWKDEYLVWDENVYGINLLRLPNTEVWKPDLALYTASPDQGMFPTVPTNVLVYSNGTVLWVPPFTISSRCPMERDAKKIKCSINFGSWTFGDDKLDLQMLTEGLDLSDFVDINHDWKLEKAAANRVSKKYACCEELYSSIFVNVTVVRRHTEGTGFLLKNLIA